MTNPFEPPTMQLPTVQRKRSRGLALYGVIHAVQAMVTIVQVYTEPMQLIQNNTILFFGQFCFATSGVFLFIGLVMIVKALLKAESAVFWRIDLLVSVAVVVLSLPAVY